MLYQTTYASSRIDLMAYTYRMVGLDANTLINQLFRIESHGQNHERGCAPEEQANKSPNAAPAF